jgi:hypothetical protein
MKHEIILNKIKMSVNEFNTFFDDVIKKTTITKFADLAGCNKSVISRYISKKFNISLERKIELLTNYYKNIKA